MTGCDWCTSREKGSGYSVVLLGFVAVDDLSGLLSCIGLLSPAPRSGPLSIFKQVGLFVAATLLPHDYATTAR